MYSMRCAPKAATVPNLRLEVRERLKQDDENMLENGVENGVKSLRIRAPAVVWSSWATLLAPRWPKMLLGVWGSIWRSVGAHLGAKMSQVAAKMALSCPTWRQDGPKIAVLDGQLEIISGGILPTFKDIGCEKPDSRKPNKTFSFYSFFEVFGGLGGALGDHVGSSWRDVGLCWASWAPSWSNLATR